MVGGDDFFGGVVEILKMLKVNYLPFLIKFDKEHYLLRTKIIAGGGFVV